MMIGKRYNRSELLIDLTSLLDVVFIVLLIVLSRYKSLEQGLSEREEMTVQKENIVSEREKAVSQRETEANSQYELYSDQLEMADNMYQYVLTVSVNVKYASTDMKERTVNILFGGETEPEEFELRGNDTENMSKFEQKLEDCIKDNDDRPIILSLNKDEEKILWRDERKIEEVFEKLASQYEHVYEKSNLKK